MVYPVGIDGDAHNSPKLLNFLQAASKNINCILNFSNTAIKFRTK